MKATNLFGRKMRIDYHRSFVEMTYYPSGHVEWNDGGEARGITKGLLLQAGDNFFIVNFRKDVYNITQYIDTQKMEVRAVFSVDGRGVDSIKGKMCFID